MKRVIIDTDPGVDDAAAILLALSSGVLQVEAVTTVFGNVEVEQCTRNALKILEVAGRSDIPVYMGSARPLVREPRFAKNFHGENGLGGIDYVPAASKPAPENAVDEIVSRVMAAPGEITLIALGAMTNVALALAHEPRLAQNLKEVILMGGAVLTWGNITPAASFNIFNDPEAAQMLYQSGAPVVQVGLDVCRPTLITSSHLNQIRAANNEIGRFLMEIADFHEQAEREIVDKGEAEASGVHFNDVPPMAYAIRPDLFSKKALAVAIETQGLWTTGQTVADFGKRWGKEPNVDVCLEVDAEGVADLFASSLASYK